MVNIIDLQSFYYNNFAVQSVQNVYQWTYYILNVIFIWVMRVR